MKIMYYLEIIAVIGLKVGSNIHYSFSTISRLQYLHTFSLLGMFSCHPHPIARLWKESLINAILYFCTKRASALPLSSAFALLSQC